MHKAKAQNDRCPLFRGHPAGKCYMYAITIDEPTCARDTRMWVQVRTLREVACGDELCINYLDEPAQHLPAALRQRELA